MKKLSAYTVASNCTDLTDIRGECHEEAAFLIRPINFIAYFSESKVTVGFLASGSFFKKEPKTLNTIFFHLLTYVFGKNSMAFRKGMIAVWGL